MKGTANIFALFFCCCVNAIFSQQAETPTEVDSLSISIVVSPVVVTGSVSSMPFGISKITAQQIEGLIEPNIAPILNATPGILMQTGTLNTNRMSIRGVGYREPFATTGIKIYLDEIPLTNGTGESNIEDINPNILSGIDIWRGPTSALWGSGLGGMIHLKTTDSSLDLLQTRMQAGVYGRFQFDQLISKGYGKNMDWSTMLSYQYLNDEGYRDNNLYRKQTVTLKQQYLGFNNWTLKLIVLGIDLKAFIPSSLNLSDFETNPSSAAPTWDAVMGNEDYAKWITGLNAVYTSPKGWIYNGSVFGTFFSLDEVRPFNVLTQNNSVTGTRQRLTFGLSESSHLTTGIEYFDERSKFKTFETLEGGEPGQKLTEEEYESSYINAFAQVSWTISKNWFFFAGFNSTLSWLSDSSRMTETPVDLFPTGGFRYSLSSMASLFASASRGFSSLSFQDMLNADGTINPEIVPETGWNFEMGMSLKTRNNSYINLSLFRMNIQNTVVTKRIMDDIFEKINGGSSIHQGVEVAYAWKPISGICEISGSYTFGDYTFDAFTDDGVVYDGNSLPGTPQHVFVNRLTLTPFAQWSFYVGHQFVSDAYLNDSNTVIGEGYSIFNTGVTYARDVGKKSKIQLSLNIHNLFDTLYSPMFQINAPGSQPRYYYPGKPISLYLNAAFTHAI